MWPLTVSHYELQIQRIGRHWMYVCIACMRALNECSLSQVNVALRSQRINLAMDVYSLQLTFLFFNYRSRCVLTSKLVYFFLQLCKRGKLLPPFKTFLKDNCFIFFTESLESKAKARKGYSNTPSSAQDCTCTHAKWYISYHSIYILQCQILCIRK